MVAKPQGKGLNKLKYWVETGRLQTISLNPGVLGSNRTGYFGFFRGNVLGQDTSERQPSTGETQEWHE